MPKAERNSGDAELHALFERFNGQLISPGGAAALLGVSRKTVYTLGQRGRIRVLEVPETRRALGLVRDSPRWVFIPLADIARYAEEVGRPFPKGHWAFGDLEEEEAEAEAEATEDGDDDA